MSVPAWFKSTTTILSCVPPGTEMSRNRYHIRCCHYLSGINMPSKQHQGLCDIRHLWRTGRSIHAAAPQHICHIAWVSTATYQHRRARAVSHKRMWRPDGDPYRRVDISHHDMQRLVRRHTCKEEGLSSSAERTELC